MLNDHCPRIHALHQQALENASMEELEKSAAPLLWMVLIVVLALTISTLANSINEVINHYQSLVAVNEATAQCMNGHAINLGDAQLSCEVREYKKLVSGLAQGDQP